MMMATMTGIQRGVLLERDGRVAAVPDPDDRQPGLLPALHGHLHRLAGLFFAAAAERALEVHVSVALLSSDHALSTAS